MFELQIPNYIEFISKELTFKESQIKTVLDLTLEWATVPFIARYRKELTWNLDENNIRDIIELNKKQENLFAAKTTAVNGITEAWMMTQELFDNIVQAKTLKEVEEIYKPFKSKKKTKAMIAIEKWFQVVADSIKSGNISIPENLLNDYSREEIIEGSICIVAAEITANSKLRHSLIEELEKYGMIESKKKTPKALEKLNEKDKDQIPKFEIYFEFSAKLWYIKPYQILALNRWENLWILWVKISKDDIIYDKVKNKYSKILRSSESKISESKKRDPESSSGWQFAFIPELENAFKDGYDALFTSVENEIRSKLQEIAEDDSIAVFQTNLKALLLTKPVYGKKILAIDPGFKAWCKVAIIDEIGNPVAFDKVFLFQKDKLEDTLKQLVKKHSPDVIVVWNGTWTQEIQKIVLELFTQELFIVNESWASVYSVSKTWEEEFPELDSLDRWTISIWRRFIDPLSELVKVPVWSIWVWMYQHDIPEKKLEEKLGYVVEDSVNEVWINVNTASIYLLNHISWIDKRQAKKIYDKRPYSSRAQLKKVLWEKAYEQAIWFLRVPESKEILDNTDIHPDQYELAKYLIENNITKVDDKAKTLYPTVNQDTIEFILNSYKNIWIEKRTNFTHSKAEKAKLASEIKVWDVILWTVRNVLAFGAFVDIWTKNDWLVHISQLTDRFVKDPNEIVKVWDKVKVQITAIDEKTGKIQLTMKGV